MENFDARKFIFGERRFVFESPEALGAHDRGLNNLDSSQRLPDTSAYIQRAQTMTELEAGLVNNLRQVSSPNFESGMISIDNLKKHFNGVPPTPGKVPKSLNFIEDKETMGKLIVLLHEKMKEALAGNTNNAQADFDNAKTILGRLIPGLSQEQMYDTVIVMSAYKMLYEAEKKFKEKYPYMNEVAGFGENQITYQVKIEAGQIVVDFNVPAALEVAYNALKQTKPEAGTSAQSTVQQQEQVEALRASKTAGFFGFLNLDQQGTYTVNGAEVQMTGYEAVARGVHPWGSFVGFFAGMEGVKGFKGIWDSLISIAGVLPGAMGTKIVEHLTSFRDRIKNGADSTVETADARNMTVSELLNATATTPLKVTDNVVSVAAGIKKQTLTEQKRDFVKVKIEAGQNVKFGGAINRQDIVKVDPATNAEVAWGTGLVNEITDAGTYKLKADLTAPTFSKGVEISIAKLPGAPTATV